MSYISYKIGILKRYVYTFKKKKEIILHIIWEDIWPKHVQLSWFKKIDFFFFLLSLCGNTCLTSIFTFESFQVMHSQRLSEKPLRPWAIVDTSGTIRSAHCDCMAGLGETCTHVAAMLFAIEYNIRQREKKTVTQEKAYWLVPSVREAPYAEASDIDFTSAKSKKKKMDSGTSSSPFQESRKPTRSIPEQQMMNSKTFTQQ